jgi:ferredoxin
MMFQNSSYFYSLILHCMPEKSQQRTDTTHTIDHALCTKCELCVKICPSGIIIRDENEVIHFREDRIDICIKCGHCMAMCETGAIAIEGLSYEDNFRPLPRTMINYETFNEFLVSRRSVRLFRDKPVSGEILQKIIDILATAPFGVHPDNVEITIVNDKKVIEQAVPYMSKIYIQLSKILNVPFLGWALTKTMPKETSNTLLNFIMPHIKKGLYDTSTGIDDITREAPCIIIFHARKGAEEHTVDGHIYLSWSLLAAHSLGLGATAIGLIGPAINQSKPLRQMFKIPAENEVVESMIVGYPKFQFKRAIVRPRKNVTFISPSPQKE